MHVFRSYRFILKINEGGRTYTYIYTFNLNMNEIGFKTDSSEIVIGENGIGFGWVFIQFKKSNKSDFAPISSDDFMGTHTHTPIHEIAIKPI